MLDEALKHIYTYEDLKAYAKRFTEPGEGMLEKEELSRRAVNEMAKIFGAEYLRENLVKFPVGKSYLPDGRFFYFAGMKTINDLPNHPASAKGWTVYAELYLDSYTGELIKMEYLKE